jgi:tetratricopeptide (TPR) repeat protein
MASTWHQEAADRVRASIERVSGSYGPTRAERVTARLNTYAGAWSHTYRAIAEKTLIRRENDAETMERRLRCLERGREQLVALIGILSNADAGISRNAMDAVFALPSAESCATTDVVAIPAMPAAPELRERVLAAERAIAEASVHVDFGEDRVAKEIIARSLPDVRAIPDHRAEAALLLLDSQCKERGDDFPAALAAAQAAFWAAQRASDDTLAVRASSRMALLLGAWLDKPEEADRWIGTAEAIADRAGRSPPLDLSIVAARIAVNANATGGRPEQNIELQDVYVRLSKELYSDRDPRYASALLHRGSSYYMMGRFDSALEDMQASINLETDVAGPSNPHLALSYANLGSTLVALGRLDEARVALHHALALQADAPAGARASMIFFLLSDVERRQGRPDVAIEMGRQGLQAALSSGLKGQREWDLRLEIAKAKGDKGDFAGMAEECASVLAVQKAAGALTPEAVYGSDSLTCLGEAELGQRQFDAAIRHFEQSVTFPLRNEPGDLLRARFALAKGLRAARRDPDRATKLAQGALDDFRKMPGSAEDVAAIEQWLGSTAQSPPQAK